MPIGGAFASNIIFTWRQILHKLEEATMERCSKYNSEIVLSLGENICHGTKINLQDPDWSEGWVPPWSER
jgi:hypothetical protein